MNEQQTLIDRMVMQRQQLQQNGAKIVGVRIHPDDLATIEAMDTASKVLDVMDATLFGVPFTEADDVPSGDPEFTTTGDARG